MSFIAEKLKTIHQRQEQVAGEEEDRSSSPRTVTRFRFDVDRVMQQVRSKIFGQDEAVGRLEEMLRVVWSDISEPSRPLYVALFLGPTGVGKTETVRALAEAIHGSAEAFCRIDMNTLAQEHYAAALTGAPPGYVGSKEGMSLFDMQRIEGSYGKPGIVLFDELEKANDQVIYSLLGVLDNGMMVLSSGEKTINFRNSIIFMTSNLGAQDITEFADGSLKAFWKKLGWYAQPRHWGASERELLRTIVQKKTERRFSPEFINRIDDVYVFRWLGRDGLGPILDSLLDSLNRRVLKHRCMVQLDPSAKELVASFGFDKQYGARSLKRAVRTCIEIPLARLLGNRRQDDPFVTYYVRGKRNGLEWYEDDERLVYEAREVTR
ncbi:AAA family ATPase [Paenibacillus ehimensis]|uniref:AAA family ATPase n=1 Tax=Paenibacillus ehimensis TaxID=79264 RepID=UPI000FD8064A|nr:AAA family ATPase [Paenibacillus ehimensis]